MRRLDGRARAGTPEQAAAFAQFVVLTTPWNAAEAAIRSMGDLNGKIILDATNPLAMGPDGLTLAIGHSTSAGEKLQGWAKAPRFSRPSIPPVLATWPIRSFTVLGR